MKTDKRKIVIVGTGMVGMSYAYCLLNQSVCDELVLIDVDKKTVKMRFEDIDFEHDFVQNYNEYLTVEALLKED